MKGKIKKITEDAHKCGYEVRIRDIAYACLKSVLGDDNVAFTVVFGTPDNDHAVQDYTSMDSIQYLIEWFEEELAPKEVVGERPEDIVKSFKKNSNVDDSGSMTFEENRAGIETQIAEILELKKLCTWFDPQINREQTDVKTLATLHKTEADLRSKLNDKFGASEKSKEQYVIVQKKFDFLCPYTRHECYQMTKEDAMKKWNLIEKE